MLVSTFGVNKLISISQRHHSDHLYSQLHPHALSFLLVSRITLIVAVAEASQFPLLFLCTFSFVVSLTPARFQAAADAEMSKLSDQQNVINELEHHNNSVRMQLEDSKLEIAHSHERLVAFER